MLSVFFSISVYLSPGLSLWDSGPLTLPCMGWWWSLRRNKLLYFVLPIHLVRSGHFSCIWDITPFQYWNCSPLLLFSKSVDFKTSFNLPFLRLWKPLHTVLKLFSLLFFINTILSTLLVLSFLNRLFTGIPFSLVL